MIGPDHHRLVRHKGATMAAATLHKLADDGLLSDLIASCADGMIDGACGYLVASLGPGAAMEALAAAMERLGRSPLMAHEV